MKKFLLPLLLAVVILGAVGIYVLVQKPPLRLAAPLGGEDLCRQGGTYDVAWEATEAIQAVNVYLESIPAVDAPSQQHIYYPAALGLPIVDGGGNFVWDIPLTVQEAYTYAGLKILPSASGGMYKVLIEGVARQGPNFKIRSEIVVLGPGCFTK